jgi:thiol-disulfide isomerase/thioredoxin/mono/diheme cytochrome c family protein
MCLRILSVMTLCILSKTAVLAGEVGAKVAPGSMLRDLHGNRRSLHDFKNFKAVVLVFLGSECPISNLYVPRLLELEKKYRSQKVQFIAVYPNDREDLDQVAVHSYDRNWPTPVLKDVGQKLADQLGISRVPAVAVLDGEFTLRYRGRIDDQYQVGQRRPKPTRADLVEALDDVLADRKVRVAETEADGCLISRPTGAAPRTDVTYTKQVSRILQKNCQTCHRPGEAAPFALMNYEDASRHGRMIKEVTTQRRMPPWHADPRHGSFANERRMNQADIDTLAAWVDAGMPQGNANDLPKVIDWPKGWKLGKPDLVLQMPEEFEVPAEGVLPYKTWVIETNFTEDRWVRLAEARPGNASVVHHVVVYILKPGQTQPFTADGTMSVLVGWAPGDLGLNCPPDTALRVPKGSRLRFELHYTPNGTKTKDRSQVGITFAKKPPRFEMLMNAFDNEAIKLPAGESHYQAEATFRLRADARILSFVPHMHWRGKHYLYEAIYPDGKKETLLSVPRWDFNWQNVYQFKEPLKMPKGTKLHAVAHWDNSRNNPLNPDPEKPVYFGLQTWEEMMVGWVAYVWERAETAEELAKNPPTPADQYFDRFDRNGDDVVTGDEIPERMKLALLVAGIKTPAKMDRKEFVTFFEEMRKRFPQRPANPNKDRPPSKTP